MVKRGLLIAIGVAAMLMALIGSTAAAPARMGVSGRAAIAHYRAMKPPSAAIAGGAKHQCRKRGTWECARGRGQGGTPPGCSQPDFVASESSGSSALQLSSPDPSVDPLEPGSLVLAAFATLGGTVTAPAGWQQVSAGGSSGGTNPNLQLFYTIPIPLSNPGASVPQGWQFSSSGPHASYSEEFLFNGLSQSDPVGAAGVAASAGPSSAVTAPSITPSGANSVLLFFGGAGTPETWTAPSGMTAFPGQDQMCGFGTCHTAPHSIEAAYQSSGSAAPTGVRSATISGLAESTGELIALNIPAPPGCPQVGLLNRRAGVISRPTGLLMPQKRVPLLRVAADDRVPVLLKCEWSDPCDGSVSLAPGYGGVFAGRDFTLSADRQATVQLPVCALGTVCPEISGGSIRLGRSQAVQVVVQVLRPNGQVLTEILAGVLAFS
jgi:hypothetical protein